MPVTLTIRDESATGDLIWESTLDLLTEHITVRELIRSRVYQEVKDYNQKQSEMFYGLVQPTDAEKYLNGFKIRKKRMIDWKSQFEAAVKSFENNQIIILVDNKQAETLEEEIVINEKTQVSFLKLTPLVGG